MKEVYELMERFHALSINEMELEYHGIRIFLKKEEGSKGALEQGKGETKEFPEKITNHQSEEIETNRFQQENQKDKKEEAGKKVTAPLAGTFYRCPSPGEAPYISVGQKVKKGEVLGVIEAMKMMNEIVAMEDGTIEEILVEDEAMVEYEQPLIVIR